MDFVEAVSADRDALTKQLVAVETRLARVAATLAADGLTVIGSRKQIRAHPLVRAERELARDATRIRNRLDVLRVRLRAEEDRRRTDEMIASANAICRGLVG
jgi:hypothetical protein